MNCKFCGEPLPKNVTRCPACGLSVEPEETQTPQATVQIVAQETQLPEMDEKAEKAMNAQINKMRRTAAIAGCVAVLAVLVLVFSLIIGRGGDAPHTEPTGSTPSGTTAPSGTVPADGNPDDVTCKGSYYVSEEQGLQLADEIVATLGDAKLTNGQLQIYYQMELIQFLDQYGYYLSYFGLDYTKPLDQQLCTLVEGYTWQHFFLESALNTWVQNQTLALEAEKNNFQLDQQYQSKLDSIDEDMTASAIAHNFDSAEALLRAQCGSNTAMDDYKAYMSTYFNGFLYFSQLCDAIEVPSDEDLAAYFQANKEGLEQDGIKQDGSYVVDVRHILIKVEGGVENADGTITFPDAAVAAEAKAKAEQILAQWQENPTEENFGILAKEHTADSNGAAGGLYTDVPQGYMVKTFNDWCFDPVRQVGDYGIVETKFGYHIMYFSGRGEEVWLTQTRQAYLSQQQSALLEQLLEQYDLKVHYRAIALDHVDLA